MAFTTNYRTGINASYTVIPLLFRNWVFGISAVFGQVAPLPAPSLLYDTYKSDIYANGLLGNSAVCEFTLATPLYALYALVYS